MAVQIKHLYQVPNKIINEQYGMFIASIQRTGYYECIKNSIANKFAYPEVYQYYTHFYSLVEMKKVISSSYELLANRNA